MKTIWARVGMSLDISDAEYEILKQQRDQNGNVVIPECDSDLNRRFVYLGWPDGETYIPSAVFEEIEEMDAN